MYGFCEESLVSTTRIRNLPIIFESEHGLRTAVIRVHTVRTSQFRDTARRAAAVYREMFAITQVVTLHSWSEIQLRHADFATGATRCESGAPDINDLTRPRASSRGVHNFEY